MTEDDKDKSFPKPADKLLEKKLPFSPHFLTPAGMLLPKHQQPPPMYGPRGATVPPKFIPKYDNVNTQPSYKNPNNSHHRGPPRRSMPVEVTLPPRNWDLWCESCDLDLPSKAQLETHKTEHKTCGVDGCKLVSHPSIIAKHVVEQHESGLYQKLKNLESPEDITLWREQRRKNYPTRANIELKQKAIEARKERGEKLDLPKGKFGRTQGDTKKKPKNRKNKQKRQDLDSKKSSSATGVAEKKKEEEEIVNQGVKMFKGTAGLWDNETDEDEEKTSTKDGDQVSSNPLLKLIGMYGDSGDSESDDEEEHQTKAEPNLVEELKVVEKQIVGPEGDAAETIINSSDTGMEVESEVGENTRKRPSTEEEQSETKAKVKRPQEPAKKKQLKSGLNYGALRRKPNTMLFKLLQDEIRHERNVLLQAVRFVVQNNFFDEPKEDQTRHS